MEEKHSGPRFCHPSPLHGGVREELDSCGSPAESSAAEDHGKGTGASAGGEER